MEFIYGYLVYVIVNLADRIPQLSVVNLFLDLGQSFSHEGFSICHLLVPILESPFDSYLDNLAVTCRKVVSLKHRGVPLEHRLQCEP